MIISHLTPVHIHIYIYMFIEKGILRPDYLSLPTLEDVRVCQMTEVIIVRRKKESGTGVKLSVLSYQSYLITFHPDIDIFKNIFKNLLPPTTHTHTHTKRTRSTSINPHPSTRQDSSFPPPLSRFQTLSISS